MQRAAAAAACSSQQQRASSSHKHRLQHLCHSPSSQLTQPISGVGELQKGRRASTVSSGDRRGIRGGLPMVQTEKRSPTRATYREEATGTRQEEEATRGEEKRGWHYSPGTGNAFHWRGLVVGDPTACCERLSPAPACYRPQQAHQTSRRHAKCTCQSLQDQASGCEEVEGSSDSQKGKPEGRRHLQEKRSGGNPAFGVQRRPEDTGTAARHL